MNSSTLQTCIKMSKGWQSGHSLQPGLHLSAYNLYIKLNSIVYNCMLVFRTTLYRTEGGGGMLSSTEAEKVIFRWSWTVHGTSAWSLFWSTAECNLPIWQIRRWCICWQVTFALKLSHRWATSCHSVLFCWKKMLFAPFNKRYLKSTFFSSRSTWVQYLSLTNLKNNSGNAVVLYS